MKLENINMLFYYFTLLTKSSWILFFPLIIFSLFLIKIFEKLNDAQQNLVN